MAKVERVVCLALAMLVADPSELIDRREALGAEISQVEETVEDRADDVADWILRLFRGADDDAKTPRSAGKGGPGNAGRSGSQSPGGSGGGGSGGDDGGDDGGGDDGGGDDGGDD